MRQLVLGCSLCLVAAACDPVESDGHIAASEHAVQDYYEGNYRIVQNEVDVIYAKATAALRNAPTSNPALTGNCGMTFISKHYGITATHCLPTQSTIQAMHVKMPSVTRERIVAQAGIVNGWPNFQHASLLTSADGYQVLPFQCVVARRCDVGTGNCPFNATQTPTDIALLYCANRPQTDWLNPTTSNSELGQPISTWWYHEFVSPVLNNTDQYNHYTLLPTNTASDQNWHYTYAHQLLPLVSEAFKTSGTAYTCTQRSTTLGQASYTDMPACHGTSGSGVMLKGSTTFLGPVVSVADGSSIIGRLCNDMNADQPGVNRTSYINAYTTAQFNNLPEITADR